MKKIIDKAPNAFKNFMETFRKRNGCGGGNIPFDIALHKIQDIFMDPICTSHKFSYYTAFLVDNDSGGQSINLKCFEKRPFFPIHSKENVVKFSSFPEIFGR